MLRTLQRIHVRYGLLAGLIFCLLSVSVAQALPVATLDKQLSVMEQQLFARNYSQEAPEERITRLEKTVFGTEKSHQSLEGRFQALGQLIQPLSTAPPSRQRVSSPPPAWQQEVPEKLPSESQYPAITAIEMRVFRQSFEQQPIEMRLSRLESRLLGQPQLGTLQERSDQLKMMVLGEVGGYPAYPQTGGSGTNNPASAYVPEDNQQDSEILQVLLPLEKKLLRQTYPQDTVENRISRLEIKVFNATAPELSPEERLYRVAGVVTAQRSARQEQVYSGLPTTGMGGRVYGGRYSQSTTSGMGNMSSILLMILMSLL